MNVIKDQREDIIRENNTAQAYLTDLLVNKLTRRTSVLDIREPLHGDIDFSIIRNSGFMFVTEIILPEGEVTSITNIPEGVERLICPKNFLFALEDLPSSLQHLEIPHNYLSTINLAPCKKLQYVNISYNALEKIEKFPTDVVEMQLNNNALRHLDLRGLDRLKILNVSNNKISVIENLTEEITDLNIDNNPSVEFRNSAVPALDGSPTEDVDVQKNMNYVQSLFDYFRLKNDYENKLHEAKRRVFKNAPNKKIGKRNASEIKAKCVGCTRPVGTVFAIRDDRYVALCGSTDKPCNLNIEIYKGSFSSHQDLLYSFKNDIEEIKDNIIKQKLDTLFSYITEEQSVKQFKSELDNYNIDAMIFKELMDGYEEKHADPHKQELIQRKKDKIFYYVENVRSLLAEYEKTGNRELLKTAVQMQVSDLIPEAQNLRLLTAELMEMNQKKHTNGKVEHFLFKNDVALTKLDHNIGEPARVIKFNLR